MLLYAFLFSLRFIHCLTLPSILVGSPCSYGEHFRSGNGRSSQENRKCRKCKKGRPLTAFGGSADLQIPVALSQQPSSILDDDDQC